MQKRMESNHPTVADENERGKTRTMLWFKFLATFMRQRSPSENAGNAKICLRRIVPYKKIR